VNLRMVRAPTEAEITLLWAAARLRSDTSEVAGAARDADVPYVLEAAERQRVAPLVLRSLGEAGLEVDPASDVVRRARLWEAHAHLALPAAAAATLEPLNAAGLKPLVLKGLAVVERYPALGLRPMDDIDVLLPRPLAHMAIKVLRRSGWHRAVHRGVDPGYDLIFRNDVVPGVPLELHYELARWQERPKGLDARRLWAGRIPTEVLGRPAWGLRPELELLTLIAHAAKRFHLFNRLLWAVDFTVIASTPTFDWDAFARLARGAHCRIAAAVGLRLARRLGADVPDDVLTLPPVLARAGALDTLLDPARPFSVRAIRQRRIAYVLIDDAAGKLRLAAGDLMRPPSGQPRSRVAGRIVRTFNRSASRLARAGLGRSGARPGS
jgi:hypothetical protein